MNFLLRLFSVITILGLISANTYSQKSLIDPANIVDTVMTPDGIEGIGIRVPGKPPTDYTGPLAEYTRGTVILQTVPAFNWCFGCSATSGAMMAGFYDNNGYPNCYAGPTNNGIMPMTNAAWSDTVISGQTRHRCPLSATGIGLDGRTTRGHIEDYWISYGSAGPDPWVVNGWAQHAYGDCTGDYMKTNQWLDPGNNVNTDANTTFWYRTDGGQATPSIIEGWGVDHLDGGYGLMEFFESRGYTVTGMYNQYIIEEGNTYGFTFQNFKDQIDAGRPVLIHVTNHTMLGYGYNDDGGNEIIYIHDTWDWLDHQMDWAGTYGGLQHYGVSVFELQASDINVWTGDYNSYWGNASNWSLGHIPTSTEHVVIPDNGIPCIVDFSLKTCDDIDVYPGAVLRIMDETLEVMGNMRIHGEMEINANSATIVVHGNIYWDDGSFIDINYTASAYVPRFDVYGTWEYLEGSDVDMTTGIVYFTGSSPSTSYIRTKSANSNFNHIRMEKPSPATVNFSNASTVDCEINGNIYLDNTCTFNSNSSRTMKVGGYLNILNNSHLKLANGTLEFNGNPGSTTLKPNTGDYVNNLRINTGSYALDLGNDYSSVLDVNGFVSIQSGIFDPNGMTLYVGGNWYNVPGPGYFYQAGTRVIFDGSGHQYIYDSEDFNILESACGAAIRLENSSTTVDVANYDWTTGGWDVIAGTLNVYDLYDNSLYGVWYLNAGGEINVSNAGGWIDLNGELHIFGGTMTVSGGSESFWGYSANALVEMTAGTLDFIDQGIVLSANNTLTENIQGGRIRVKEGFNGSARSDFTPIGGMFEFYGTADFAINQGAGNNFCYMEVNKGSATADKTTGNANAERSRKQVQQKDLYPDHPDITSDSRSNRIYLSGDLVLTDDLIISTGELDVSASNYRITLGGDWTNYVGSAGFNERAGTVEFNGANPAMINTDETFYDLVLNKTYSSYAGLELNAYDVFTVLDDLRILDGCIEMNDYSDLIVSDSIVISANAGLNAYGDLGLEISLGGHWYNYNTTYDAAGVGFNPGTSTVTFNGPVTQYVYSNASEEDFYDLVIDKPVGIYFRPIDNIAVLDDLNIQSGIWHDNTTSRNHYFYGDFTVSATDGGFYSTMNNTVRFMGTGDQYVNFPPAAGGYFYNVIIDKVAPADRSFNSGEGTEPAPVTKASETKDGSRAMTTYLSDDLISLNSGYLYLYEGNLDLSGNYYRCTGNVYIYDGATLMIDDNAWIEVGGGSDLRVYSGGTLEAIGSSGNDAGIEGHNDLEYDFFVYSGGTISAEYASFENMSQYGVYVFSGGIVDVDHPFDNCTFRYGSTTVGACLLRIENNQALTIDGINFPEAAPAADYNITKTSYDQGSITLTNATGPFAGPLYENDTYNRIFWDGQGNWLGTNSSSWGTASNWGFNYIPDLTIDVYIGPGCPNYPVVPGSLGVSTSTSVSYYCNALEIDAGGELTVTTGAIYNYGTIIVNDMLNIGDDLNSYSGSVVYLYDTIYTGNYTGYHGRLNMLSGSVLFQYAGSDIFFETLLLHDGCDYYGYGGRAHVYNSGSYPAINTIEIDDANSYFSDFIVEYGTNAQLSACSYDLDVSHFQIYGDFSPAGFEATAEYIDVYGGLILSTGLITVTANGPYFQHGSSLAMSGGTINGGNNIVFTSTATENVTDGTISVDRGFTDNNGVFSPTGGVVVFNTSEAGNIYGSPQFYHVEIDKPGAILQSGTEGAGAAIYVMTDLDLLNGTFELNTGSVLEIDNTLNISSGATLDADDAWPVNILVGDDWFDMNTGPGGFLSGSGSSVTFDGVDPAQLQAVREKSEFNRLVVNTGTVYVRPSGTAGGNVFIHADSVDIQSGALRVSGYRVEVDHLMSIAGTLRMDLAEDTLIVHDIVWGSGSADLVSSGKIFVNGDWTWENGTNAYISSGNTVYFDAPYTQFIYSNDASAAFYDLEIDKGGGSWAWIHTSSTEDVHVLGNMNVHPGCGFHVQVDDLQVDGVLDIMSGASMRLYNSGDLTLTSDFTLNGYLDFDGGGNALFHGMFDLAATGHIEMSGGTCCCDAPYSAARGFCMLEGDFDLSGSSVFEVLHNHISIGSGFNGNISGGTIRVGGSFISNVGPLFQPSGGTLDYIGSVSSGTYISMADGNWLHNLVIDGGTYNWDIYSSGALHVKKDLVIESGTFTASTDTIYLGDDWINNVGSTAFMEGTGLVILNGADAVDIQQIFGETFYDLENRNVARHIDIAGNTTVMNNYYAAAGGPDCETFVTASTFNIQNTLYLDEGSLGLSASAPVVTVAQFDQGGTLNVTNGTFTANDIIEDFIEGDYILQNGTINLNQDPGGYFDIMGNIEIHNGTMNLIGGYDNAWWPALSSPYSFEMTGGVLDFQDVGVYLRNNFLTCDITGGSIRTVGDFISESAVNVFDPAGGNVILYGPFDTDVSLGSGSYFNSLVIDKWGGATVTTASALTIKDLLRVASGNFNTAGFLINVVP